MRAALGAILAMPALIMGCIAIDRPNAWDPSRNPGPAEFWTGPDPVPGPLSLLVEHDGRLLVMGRASMLEQLSVWEIGRAGDVSALAPVTVKGAETWTQARSVGSGVELLGFWTEGGMCCAKYYGDGSHGDGYYQRFHPIRQTWNPVTNEILGADLACEDRGRFSSVTIDDDTYIVGGRASWSTDAPARYDARRILRVDAATDACEFTGLLLPANASSPFVVARGRTIHVIPARADGTGDELNQSVIVDLDAATVQPSGLRLPLDLDPYEARLVAGPRFSYILGAPAKGSSLGVLRLDPDAREVTLLEEALDRGMGGAAVGIWQDRILIVGGGHYNSSGERETSSDVTFYWPSNP